MMVRITDPDAAPTYRLGVELLIALSGRPEFEWRRDGDALRWLVGTPRLLDDIKQGKTVEQIIDADRADHATWAEARQPVLLY